MSTSQVYPLLQPAISTVVPHMPCVLAACVSDPAWHYLRLSHAIHQADLTAPSHCD